MSNAFTVRNFKVSHLTASLNQPFRIALGQHDFLDNVLFTLELEGKAKGYGEAAVATHITGETVAVTIKNLESVGLWLKGRSAADYMTMSGSLHERLKGNMAALAAVETALLDALTRAVGMPLWRLWTDQPRVFKTDITIVISDLPETIAKAKEFYAKGFRAFKVKVGRDLDLDIQRVAAVAEIAPRSSIIIDANQGFDAKGALCFLKELGKLGIVPDLIEQPVARDDWEGLKKVTRLARVCVCADESASSLPDALRVIREHCAGAINIKLMKTGIIQSVCIARWAKANGLRLMIGGMMESNLAMTAAAHMAAGLKVFDFIDLDTPFFIKGEAARNPYLTAQGVYDVHKVKSGIGICL